MLGKKKSEEYIAEQLKLLEHHYSGLLDRYKELLEADEKLEEKVKRYEEQLDQAIQDMDTPE